MIELLGTSYYTGGFATALFGLITLILIFIFWLIPTKSWSSKKKLLIFFGVLDLGIFGLLHWDIIVAGQQLSKMCREQGGMHIYKTVEADGMAGLLDIKYWSEYGFSYAEYFDSRDDIIRSTLINGKVVKENVNEISSQYIRQTKRENVARLVDKSFIIKITHSVVDRSNGDTLGELVYFTIDRGWADHWVPGEYTPWTSCNKEMRNGKNFFLTVDTLVEDVVKPLNK